MKEGQIDHKDPKAWGTIHCFFANMCSNVGSICRLQSSEMGHMCNGVVIHVQGYMPIMGNICILVFLVTLLIALSAYEACILT